MRSTIAMICLFTGTMLLTPCGASSQDSTSHREAVSELLAVMNVERTLDQAMEIGLDAQLRNNPGLKPYEGILRSFLSKYMSWTYLEDRFIEVYMREFTEPELRTICAFYRTDVGKKAIEKLPVLLAKGAEIGQQAVQEHLGELTAAIEERARELNAKE